MKIATKPTAKTTATTSTTALPEGQARQRDLQAMLLHRQHELQGVLQRRVRNVPSTGASDGFDETEHAEADIQEHIEVALIQMKSETLERVREALVRLNAGEYGYCAECESEISEKRLQALPFAVRCKDCEELHEQHGARERRAGSPQHFSALFANQAGS
jgi:DnaK suppressor protein